MKKTGKSVSLILMTFIALLVNGCGGGGGNGGSINSGSGTGGSITQQRGALSLVNGFDVWDFNYTSSTGQVGKLCMQLKRGQTINDIELSPLFVDGYREATMTGTLSDNGDVSLTAASFGNTRFTANSNIAALTMAGAFSGTSAIGSGSFSGKRVAGKHSCFWESIDNHEILDVIDSNETSEPAIAIDPLTGYPVVAFIERVNGVEVGGVIPFEQKVYVKRWNGTAWTLVGGNLNSGNNDIAGQLHLALDGQGVPVATWTERDKTTLANHVYAKRWNGASWDTLGGAAVDSLVSMGSSPRAGGVVVDDTGAPVVAVEGIGFTGNFDTRVLRWNGAAWEQLGSAFLSSYTYDLVVDPVDGKFGILAGRTSLGVSKWNRTTAAWEGLGGPIMSPGSLQNGTLAFRSGVPVVAYEYLFGTSGVDVVTKAADGTWVRVTPGVSISPSTSAVAPHVAVDGNNDIVVAIQNGEDGVVVKKAVNGQWKLVGSAIDSPLLYAAGPAVIAYNSGGKLFATLWEQKDASGSSDVVVYGWPLSQ